MPTPLEIEKELETALTSSLQSYCQKLALDLSTTKNQLINPEVKAAEFQTQMQKEVIDFKKRCTVGLVHCIKAVKSLAAVDPTIDLKATVNNLQASFAKLDSTRKIQTLSKEAYSGISWSILIGLTDQTLQTLYKGAEEIFKEKRYEDAIAAFSFLATIDTTQYAFWIGLGHANFHAGKMNDATKAYTMAGLCDPFSVWPHFYAANCFEAIKDYPQAVVCLHEAESALIQSALPDKNLDEVIHQRIQELKNR